MYRRVNIRQTPTYLKRRKNPISSRWGSATSEPANARDLWIVRAAHLSQAGAFVVSLLTFFLGLFVYEHTVKPAFEKDKLEKQIHALNQDVAAAKWELVLLTATTKIETHDRVMQSAFDGDGKGESGYQIIARAKSGWVEPKQQLMDAIVAVTKETSIDIPTSWIKEISKAAESNDGGVSCEQPDFAEIENNFTQHVSMEVASLLADITRSQRQMPSNSGRQVDSKLQVLIEEDAQRRVKIRLLSKLRSLNRGCTYSIRDFLVKRRLSKQ
jgi:hypothetical protein